MIEVTFVIVKRIFFVVLSIGLIQSAVYQNFRIPHYIKLYRDEGSLQYC